MAIKLETIVGDHLHTTLVKAVELTAVERGPVAFDFNNWHFETVFGETFEDAKKRLAEVVGFPITTRPMLGPDDCYYEENSMLPTDETLKRVAGWVDGKPPVKVQ